MSRNSDFHIFRAARRCVPAGELVARIDAGLLQLSPKPSLEETIPLLLLAGELECALECALADVEAAQVSFAEQLTSLLADAALAPSQDRPTLSSTGRKLLANITYDNDVGISAPEGFAYYALHPLDYADVIEQAKLERQHAFVVGIRTIGTTLSAVVCAKLSQLGTSAERTTVRPTGHPYDRTCTFSVQQRESISQALHLGAQFFVCDEGPGRSGSSLLSVAEALECEGIPTDRIVMMCSHEPYIGGLCARDAARRWQRYRSLAAGMTRRLPQRATEYAGGGDWRRLVLDADASWPAIWPQMERLKFLSADHSELFTFEGYGPYGEAISNRNVALSDSGYGVPYLGHEAGFGAHGLPPGRLAQRGDVTEALLIRMARYCAWRAICFTAGNSDVPALEEMARINLEREFGDGFEKVKLEVARPAICDNRMAPHHWLFAKDGRFLKLDAAIHGDDHFFPGPCDIAWDLAGVIVEWELAASAREMFLAEYRRSSGDDPSHRIQDYELAYAIFRLGWSKMASASVAGTEEEVRLLRDYRRYRKFIQRLSGCRTRQSRRPPAAARPHAAQEKSAAPGLP